jgi:hypothetical protein
MSRAQVFLRRIARPYQRYRSGGSKIAAIQMQLMGTILVVSSRDDAKHSQGNRSDAYNPSIHCAVGSCLWRRIK